MNWLRSVLEHFTARRTPEEQERARRVVTRLAEADPVIREYRKLDGILEIHVRRAR